MPIIVDAHLDLAYNVVRGRDPRQPAADQPVAENEIATVGLPDLRAGGVGLVCATIFCTPKKSNATRGYATADEARRQALDQFAWYQQIEREGLLRWVTSRGDVPTAKPDGKKLPAILLLEGADAFRGPDDVAEWHAKGLRMVGLAWKATRSAGGTGEPGPLTDEGRGIVKAMDALGMIHDTSHLAEESFWNLLDATTGPVVASHSNCRAIVPTDRQLSDDMIKAIAKRGGVIGLNFYDKFLLPPREYGQRRATTADLAAHARHIADVTGSATHVGLGSDMDGGLGREQIPQEIVTSADLPKIADALKKIGFTEPETAGILGENWLAYFRKHLPL